MVSSSCALDVLCFFLDVLAFGRGSSSKSSMFSKPPFSASARSASSIPASSNSSNPASEALRFDPGFDLLEVLLLTGLPGRAILLSVALLAGKTCDGTFG